MGLTFYSSHGERISKSSSETKKAYEKRENKSIFKRNPHLRIMFIDLLIVLLFAFILVPLFVKITNKVEVDDYKFLTKTIIFEEKLLLSIKISKGYKKINKRVTTNTIKIVILSIDGTVLDESTEIFPTDAGDNKFITFKLEDPSLESLSIRLSSGEFEKKYNVSIER
ncbi:MAG: hypothetical protein B6229_00145 [Spirochaetaceae bacterium 4572_7]|nr:MAG: hypothetical protein B6229_00145 [Spirochaetaceae bacterium 4572_7]